MRKKPIRPEKKSETLEVRLSWSEKRELVAHCRANGISASALLRDLIARKLERPAWRRFLTNKGMHAMSFLKRLSPAAAGTAAFALSGSLALLVAAPSTASDHRSTFDTLDVDRDGVVTVEEFLGFSQYAVVRTEHVSRTIGENELIGEVRREFAQYDRNRDGEMTYGEFTGRFGTVIAATFLTIDANGDGQISPVELSARLALAGGDVSELFSAHDGDNDGLLSFVEFSGSES